MTALFKKTHGMTYTKEYRTWGGIKGRCLTPSDAAYPKYGGAGLKMEPDWVNSFDAFFQDVGPAPTAKHSIDRIDNSLGYLRGNCRWATRKQQNRNKKKNVWITAFGETKQIAEWCEDKRCNVSRQTLYARIFKCRWNTERALSLPSTGSWCPGGKLKNSIKEPNKSPLKSCTINPAVDLPNPPEAKWISVKDHPITSGHFIVGDTNTGRVGEARWMPVRKRWCFPSAPSAFVPDVYTTMPSPTP